MSSIITEKFIMDYYETLNLNERYSLIQKLMNINNNDNNKSAASAIIEEKPQPQLKPEIEDIVEEKEEELLADDKKMNNLKIGAIHKYYIILTAIKQLIKDHDDKKIRILNVEHNIITFLDDNSMLNSIRMDNNNGYIIKYYNDTIINTFISLWRIELNHLLEYNSPVINGIQYANIYLFCDDGMKLLQKINIKYGILHDNQKIRLSNMMAIYNKANNNEECDDLINSYNIKIKKYQEYIKDNIKYRIKPALDCPVCLEQTKCVIGYCKHPLCKDCYKKIQFDSLNIYKRCPLCRQDIKCIKNCQVEKI